MHTAYLPPISWFARLCQGEPCVVGENEYYEKQTIRNRCTIDSPNGPLRLTVPIDKANFLPGAKCLMRDVRISYRQDWQHQHWSALETTYYNSPFFEYLQDDFLPLYQRHWDYLTDLNEALIQKCCELIDIDLPTSHAPSIKARPQDSPTQQAPAGRDYPHYYQVFAHKHSFLPDLSIVDLIFNLGPESMLYLMPLKF